MSTAAFTTCLAFTLRYEGGKVDDRRDPGGRTCQGVTQRTFTAWLAKQGQASRDVYAITGAERDAIYRGSYWTAVKGDMLPAGVDLAMFDFGVNSGPARALKAYAKRASLDAADTVRTVCANRLSMLHALATFKTFGRGWTARVSACEATGVKMAEHARIGAAVDAPVVPQVATKLKAAGKVAAAAADRHTGNATASTIAGTAAVVTQSPSTPAALHLPWPALALVAIVASIGVSLLLWRAHQQRARATAYVAVANGA